MGMSNCLKMVFSLFLFLFMRWFVEIGASQDECKVSRCSNHGPVIRFPFRLKDQPYNCGYPGFEISCIEKKQTILELPYSVSLSVKKINYNSQEIIVHDPDFCLQRQLQNLSLSASPFQFKLASSNYLVDYTFFNCSSKKTHLDYFFSIPCTVLLSNPVYAVDSDYNLELLDLSSCHKIYDVTLPVDMVYGENYFSLTWSELICGNCEREGKKCRLKSNVGKEPETDCIDKPAKVIALYHVYSSDKLERENTKKIEQFLEDYKALKPSRYSYADIKKITNHFKEKLGQGGYGTVYKGRLSSDVLVAVKILNNSKENGEEFINEVATMGRIHHVNVVRLVGFCADGVKRALVYEFLPNESLEKYIFSKSIKDCSLSWEKLRNVALGIAKGIEYLHQGCDKRILHFDIKPHNILLDQNFNPKISDFGLAKLCSKEQSAVSMTTARGTMGYIAPEVLSRNFGNVSYKSDIYSFGMLLLEMVGGRKNIDVTMEKTSQVYFPEWVYNQLDQGEDVCIRIVEDGDTKIAKKLTIVGLWCIQWYPIDRPSMKVVIQMLEGGGNNLTMPPNPFASIDATRTNTRRRKRSLQQELAVISELIE
ncbi:Rust resistance kinase Lr10 [Vitis vinifera]|uniref:non-specific serine/threonine protein kinase n=1 Tax=Vitis vinifera TaxID=29760 RepID=A0A438CWT9_VITVI|nr:Rust resistance kinase Lr10 [Vitis vinifera]RVW74436.1 Rust resistance kinase Lr10 [Vitis vinifera]